MRLRAIEASRVGGKNRRRRCRTAAAECTAGCQRERVTPVDRQQLLVGHGAECMVGQEARAGPGATGTAISSMGSGPARAWTCTGPFEPRFGRSGACFERSVPGDRECGRIGLRCGIAPPGSRKTEHPTQNYETSPRLLFPQQVSCRPPAATRYGFTASSSLQDPELTCAEIHRTHLSRLSW